MGNNSQWLSISPLQGSGDDTITVSAGENTGDVRTCNIMISSETVQQPVVVQQKCKNELLCTFGSPDKISSVGGQILLETSEEYSTTYTIHCDSEWVSLYNVTDANILLNDVQYTNTEGIIKLIASFEENATDDSRSAIITMRSDDPNHRTLQIIVNQEANSTHYIKLTGLLKSVSPQEYYTPEESPNWKYNIGSNVDATIVLSFSSGSKIHMLSNPGGYSQYVRVHSPVYYDGVENDYGNSFIFWIKRDEVPYISTLNKTISSYGGQAILHYCGFNSGASMWFDYDSSVMEIWNVNTGRKVSPNTKSIVDDADFWVNVFENDSESAREITIVCKYTLPNATTEYSAGINRWVQEQNSTVYLLTNGCLYNSNGEIVTKNNLSSQGVGPFYVNYTSQVPEGAIRQFTVLERCISNVKSTSVQDNYVSVELKSAEGAIGAYGVFIGATPLLYGWGFVKDIIPKEVYLDKTTLTLTPGYSDTITATVLPSDVIDAVTWKTSDPSIATVDNGVVFAKSAGNVTITATTEDGSASASCSVTVNSETYDYHFAAVLDGSADQGEDTGLKLFSNEMTNWTLFGYADKSIHPQTDNNATLYQIVVNASPWTGLRIDADNSNYPRTTTDAASLVPRFLCGSDTYINTITGVGTSGKPKIPVNEAKHPFCFSRDGSTFKYSLDGVNWTEITGVTTAQLSRLANCILTVGFDYKRASGSITTTKYRLLKTDSECCVALKNESEYPFYTLYHKYDTTL